MNNFWQRIRIWWRGESTKKKKAKISDELLVEKKIDTEQSKRQFEIINEKELRKKIGKIMAKTIASSRKWRREREREREREQNKDK
jgi:hypothetical protein